MSSIDVGYRISIDQFLSSKEDYISFLNYYNSYFSCSELKITPEILDSNMFEYIILNYLKGRNYCRNFHIDKNYIYGSSQDLGDLFSLLNGAKTNLVTHLRDGRIDLGILQSIRHISTIIPAGNRLLLENPSITSDIFEYIHVCEELSKKLNSEDIGNACFCLDFGHVMQTLSEQGVSFDSYYEFLSKQTNYLRRIKEFHLHDYRNGKDHQVFNEPSDSLNKFKTLFMQTSARTIILENNVSDDVEETGVKQIQLVKKVLPYED